MQNPGKCFQRNIKLNEAIPPKLCVLNENGGLCALSDANPYSGDATRFFIYISIPMVNQSITNSLVKQTASRQTEGIFIWNHEGFGEFQFSIIISLFLNACT